MSLGPIGRLGRWSAAHARVVFIAWAVVLVGAFLAGLIARGAVERRADAAYGVVYIAPAVIALVWVRSLPDGLWWTLLLFVVTWFAGFVVYRLVKTPR